MFKSPAEREDFRARLIEGLAAKLVENPDLKPLDPVAEADHVVGLLDDPDKVGIDVSNYSSPEFQGVGGSGVVISAGFDPQQRRRAIKVPRRAIYEGKLIAGQVEPIDPETRALQLLSHEGITRLHEAARLPHGVGWCIVTELVADPLSLLTYAEELCATQQARRSPPILEEGLRAFALTLSDVIRALSYLHDDARLLHFDIKPDNVLVSRTSRRAYVTDLGFAREVTRYGPEEEVEVRFTAPYAHPRLTEWPRIKVSKYYKAQNVVRGKELGPQFDLFAFGRTLQEILRRIADVVGDQVHTSYAFTYLHLIAVLCLDGHNSGAEQVPTGWLVSDTTMGLAPAFFAAERLTTFSEVRLSLDRLLGRGRIEDELPELDSWAGWTINVSDHEPTVMTPRVKGIIDHPTFQRLRHVYQLGLAEAVYPTANHTRYQHALGTYHAAREYLLALYYDPESPTFRALFAAEPARRLLLAALVHDIGHTSLFHELEELDEAVFSHGRAGDLVLRSGVLDSRGESLRDIVEGSAPDGWAVDLAALRGLLNGVTVTPMEVVYHDILDSHIDADKFDYLMRDSVESRVRYGHGVDQIRFLRSLTTAPDPGGRLRLAVRQKGVASAEAFAFARYQLYQALYWHHTTRAIKGMFLTAVALIADAIGADTQQRLDESWLQKLYVDELVLEGVVGQGGGGSVPPAGGAGSKTVEGRAKRALTTSPEPPRDLAYSMEPTLRFFWKLSHVVVPESAESGIMKGRRLLEHLMARQIYRRVFEVPLSRLDQQSREKLTRAFGTPGNRLAFGHAVSDALEKAMRTAIQSKSTSRQSLVEDRVLEKFAEICASVSVFVADMPTRGWTSGGDAPQVVPDAKRRYFRPALGPEQPSGETVWSGMFDFMRQAANLRVFAHPDAHSILRAVLAAGDVRDVLTKLPELKSLASQSA